MDSQKINFITQKFFINSKVLSIDLLNYGYINKTYIVEHLYNGKKSKFILQSLSDIFESHSILNDNHKLITEHINKKINNNYLFLERWGIPSLIKCKSNNLFSFPFESSFWRAMVYIDGTFSLDSLEDELMAFQTGIGLAKFHTLCSDLDITKLENTIKDFHNTKYYLDQYIISIREYDSMRFDDTVNKRIQSLRGDLAIHISYVESLCVSLKKHISCHDVIHGDPKLSNFLFDIQFKYVVSLIDLDTVSYGCLLTDLADCIRSICNIAGENPENIDNVSFDINSCKSFLNGYFSINKAHNINTFRFLPEFIYLIIFELTVRFFTDFLQSNPYFKIKYETHNLFRAEVQYRLLSKFLAQIPIFSDELHEIGIYSSSTFVSDVEKFV